MNIIYNFSEEEQTLLLRAIEFLKRTTIDRSSCHGLTHGLKIFENTFELMEKLNIPRDWKFIFTLIGALFHDIADHKFNTPITVFDEFEYEHIELMKEFVQLVSFSKEKMYREKNQLNIYQKKLGILSNYLDYVKTADRLDSIGEMGLKRCIKFTLQSQKGIGKEELKQKVIEHVGEKLGILVRDGYIIYDLERAQKETDLMTPELINNLVEKFYGVEFNPYD